MQELNQNDPRLDELVSSAYPEGIQEVAELLTFLPEQQREATVLSFAIGMLQS